MSNSSYTSYLFLLSEREARVLSSIFPAVISLVKMSRSNLSVSNGASSDLSTSNLYASIFVSSGDVRRPYLLVEDDPSLFFLLTSGTIIRAIFFSDGIVLPTSTLVAII